MLVFSLTTSKITLSFSFSESKTQNFFQLRPIFTDVVVITKLHWTWSSDPWNTIVESPLLRKYLTKSFLLRKNQPVFFKQIIHLQKKGIIFSRRRKDLTEVGRQKACTFLVFFKLIRLNKFYLCMKDKKIVPLLSSSSNSLI